jgi:hypothetical protein
MTTGGTGVGAGGGTTGGGTTGAITGGGLAPANIQYIYIINIIITIYNHIIIIH